MRTLATFSPAETLILLEGQDTKIKDLLKVTLMDLIRKQVLERDPSVQEDQPPYLPSGPNLQSYKPLLHENIFLSWFRRNPNGRMLLTNVIKVAYENAGSVQTYRRDIMDNPEIQSCFVWGFRKIFMGRFTLTDYGTKIKKELVEEKRDLESTLPDLMRVHPQEALSVLKDIQGGVFVFRGVDFKLMQQIETQVLTEEGNRYARRGTGDFDDVLFWLLIFDTHHHVDSTVHDTFHSPDSGCSGFDGDSGDSGCSGCGGD